MSLAPLSSARADDEIGPTIQTALHVASGKGSAGTTSLSVRLVPSVPSSRDLPPLNELRIAGPIGPLDLRGIPVCRPTARSTRSSGCSVPTIGRARGFAYESFGVEEGITLKQYGSFRLYSGGQVGGKSKVFLWASFPGTANHSAGRALVITGFVKGSDKGSELLLQFPHPEADLFAIAELNLSFDRLVTVDGKAISVSRGSCPAASDRALDVGASFWGDAASITGEGHVFCAD